MSVFSDLTTFVHCGLCGALVEATPDGKVAHLVNTHAYTTDDATEEATGATSSGGAHDAPADDEGTDAGV